MRKIASNLLKIKRKNLFLYKVIDYGFTVAVLGLIAALNFAIALAMAKGGYSSLDSALIGLFGFDLMVIITKILLRG